jgi:peptidoglycan hydrolase-like protein with peptidoglycan-binding domain
VTIANGKVSWAVARPLGPETEPAIDDIVLIFHSMVGYLRGTEAMFRAGGYDGTESTWGLGGPWDGPELDGVLWQWQVLGRQADAQFDGNGYADSCECSDGGHPNHPFSSKMLESLVRLGVDFCRYKKRTPYLVPRTGPLGKAAFGYHELRPEWNRDGHTCPGAVREGQLRQIVIPKIRAIIEGGTAAKPVVHSTPGVHLTVDGIFGTGTISALQHVLGVVPDGVFGPNTRRALQRYLMSKGFYHGVIDGVVGPITVKAWKAYLTHLETFHGVNDGNWGRALTAALQTALNEGKF